MHFRLFSSWKNRYLLTIISILGGYFFVYLSTFLDPHQEHSVCIYKNITGYPCPGCGMTRSTISLFRGDFLQSLMWNPLAIIVNIMAITALIWMLYDLITNKPSFDKISKIKLHPIYLIIIALIVLANWIWNFKKGY